MISRLRTRFGTAGLVLGTAALVVALAGGAYAASGGLSGKQKKEVEKIAKKFAGKPGAPGGPGAAGPAGAKGDPGVAGTGTPGPAGKSVVTAAEAKGANCAEGGTSVEVEGSATKKFVCNGKEGKQGKAGSPWTAGGTLPAGASLVGIWGNAGQLERQLEGVASFPISFLIPLASPPAEVVIVHNDEESVAGKCPGRGGGAFPTPGPAEPTYRPTTPMAEEGILCIYEDTSINVSNVSGVFAPEYFAGAAAGEEFWYPTEGASTVGAIIVANCFEAEGCVVNGTWAVTAPEE